MHKLFKNSFIVLIFLVFTGLEAGAQAKSTTSENSALEVFIPNAFTPNGDGLNDNFRPSIAGVELEYYDLMIYDRNGDTVFESQDQNEFWNGSGARGGTYYANASIYIYFLKLKAVDDVSPRTFTGHIVLLR